MRTHNTHSTDSVRSMHTHNTHSTNTVRTHITHARMHASATCTFLLSPIWLYYKFLCYKINSVVKKIKAYLTPKVNSGLTPPSSEKSVFTPPSSENSYLTPPSSEIQI